jgi:hypothetical protein
LVVAYAIGHKLNRKLSCQMDELEKMLAKLLEDARKFPPGQKRHELLKEIGRFRVKLDAFKKRKKSQPTK